MRAPKQAQLALLQMQECDTALARLTFEAKNLPVHSQIEQLRADRDKLTRLVADLQVSIDECAKHLQRLESDRDRAATRRTRQSQKLDAGLGDLRELRRLQSEVASLDQRIEAVESDILDQEERIEQLRRDLEAARSELEAVGNQIDELQQSRDAEVADLKAQADPLIARRRQAMEVAGSELTAEYDAIRKRTGGIGAVEMRGRRMVGFDAPISPAELSKILASPEDELVYSDDMEWILVRTESDE